MIAMFLWACGQQPPSFDGAAIASAGDVTVRAVLDPDPPGTAGNHVWLDVRRGDSPVTEPPVVDAMMPQMGAMPEMHARADVQPAGDGLWLASFDLPMGGGWTLDVDTPGGRASWAFTVGSRGLVGEQDRPAPPTPVDLPDTELPDAVLAPLREAVAAADQARALLAKDRTDGLAAIGGEIGDRIDLALPSAREADARVGEWLALARTEARAMGRASDLDAARKHYAELNRALIAVASAEPRLTRDLHVFSCPMTSTFPKWIQADAAMDNPYMGRAMPGCGAESEWTSLGPTPGSGDEGAVTIDAGRRQQFGIRTGPVERRSLTVDVRALGEIRWDETRIEDIVPTVGGFIRDLRVDETGQQVRKGQVLFVLYSPELFAAEQEFLLARARGADDPLARAGRRRLELLGLTSRQIDELAAAGEPDTETPILSPVTGYVVEKDVVEGSAFAAGQRVFRIAPLSEVWVEAQVYSQDVPYVSKGAVAAITLPNLPGESFEARVDLLQPNVGAAEHTRTARLRLKNVDERLLPGMYADVRFEVPLGERLVVPDSAVLYVGERRLVFVEGDGGRLIPRTIEVGARGQDAFEVRSGLREGETVVTSGTFLVAAESRMRAATELWEAGDGSR
ncbi:MAG: efflux RND transporter periplasmic adaptor subunit [Alphaproteobacteria bacterium]|nr:efflux RND transporter periplasmic adaptor subunit [Alphaproteobacteria bacterium]